MGNAVGLHVGPAVHVNISVTTGGAESSNRTGEQVTNHGLPPQQHSLGRLWCGHRSSSRRQHSRACGRPRWRHHGGACRPQLLDSVSSRTGGTGRAGGARASSRKAGDCVSGKSSVGLPPATGTATAHSIGCHRRHWAQWLSAPVAEQSTGGSPEW